MNTMKLPANCAGLNENEKLDTIGGSAVETAAKAVIAIGGAVALTGVAAVAAAGVLSIFNPNFYKDLIGDSMTAGKNFIGGAVDAGQNFLNKLMGISQL